MCKSHNIAPEPALQVHSYKTVNGFQRESPWDVAALIGATPLAEPPFFQLLHRVHIKRFVQVENSAHKTHRDPAEHPLGIGFFHSHPRASGVGEKLSLGGEAVVLPLNGQLPLRSKRHVQHQFMSGLIP